MGVSLDSSRPIMAPSVSRTEVTFSRHQFFNTVLTRITARKQQSQFNPIQYIQHVANYCYLPVNTLEQQRT